MSTRSQAVRSQVRLRAAMLAIMVLISLFAARLLQLQAVDPKSLALMAQESGVKTIDLPAKRGQILDRVGRPLADSVEARQLIADPLTTAPYSGVIATVLAKELGLDYFEVLAQLQITGKGGRFQVIARRVPSTKAAELVAKVQAAVKPLVTDPELKKLPFGGIYTEPDTLRVYPQKDVAANLLGFLNDLGEPAGGLEASFNSTLEGKDGSDTYEVGSGNRIPLGDNSTVAPVDGHSVQLTIDSDLQWYVQRVLRTAVQGSRAESGTAVVMNTKTGELLALADFPTLDANDPGASRPAARSTRALADVYEPGSVQKVLTVSALLDKNLVSPRTKVTVPSELAVQDRTIHDWFPHGTIRLTMAGVIARSSNIGTAMAARKLTNEQLHGYLSNFGLGSKTGLGLPGESRGILPDASRWQPINQATIAFGQGVSVNAVQMAAAVNTVANAGEYVSPSLIQGGVKTTAGTKVGTATSTRHQVISVAAAQKMARMMEMVTDEQLGTAPGARVPGYRVAGKTGTAQRVGAKCGCYDGTFTVSFAGFAPADSPEFTVYVVIQNPRNGGGGGSIGGPAFSKIMRYLLSRYGVTPTETPAAHLPIRW